MSVQAFQPQGPTITFAAATTAPPAVQALSAGAQTSAYRIVSNGSTIAFMGVGKTAAAALSAATVANGLPLLPGEIEVLQFYPNAFFTAITTTGSEQIYVTPGEGM